ncbi:PfkB family carbohydrate kinase [Lentisphaerota bacterium WC36G]|nr:PfkB family carbohydrate kinase [Lentisphaerae bacterium WC36]
MPTANQQNHIIVVGANPAYQKNLYFDNLNINEVNRATKSLTYAAGKGVNFCKAAQRFHQYCSVIQFLGESNCKDFIAELKELNIHHNSILVEQPTRTTITAIDTEKNYATELIETSSEVSPEDEIQYLESFNNLCKQKNPNPVAVAICGTTPKGVSNNFYSKILNIAKNIHGKKVLLDAYINIKETLSSEIPIDILKINQQELFSLTGEKDIISGIQLLLTRNAHLKDIAITNGANQAYFFNGDTQKLAVFEIPNLTANINPIGAGDTASAVLLTKILNGVDKNEAFKYALATASASCLNDKCAEFSFDDVKPILHQINIKYLN